MEVVNNEKRQILIHSESLKLYNKVVFVYEYQKQMSDPAFDCGVILNEIAAGLLKINEWNNDMGNVEKPCPFSSYQRTFGGIVKYSAPDAPTGTAAPITEL